MEKRFNSLFMKLLSLTLAAALGSFLTACSGSATGTTSQSASAGGGGAGQLTVTTSGLPDATVNQVYNASLAASGGTSPLIWAIVGGALPPGLSLDPSSGVISGTPSSAGAFSFTAEVTDNAGGSDRANLSIQVNPEGAQPLTITTTSLPDGNVGVSYSAQLSALGGTPPLSWSISTGTLPPGLSLGSSTGAISGTPTTQGSSSFTVSVSDGQGGSDSQALAIQINQNPAATAPVAPTALVASPVSRDRIDLVWADNSNNEDGFDVQRCQNSALNCDANQTNYSLVSSTGANVAIFNNFGLTADTTYSYRVRAFNAAGNSGFSNTAEATTLPDTVPPGAINITSCQTLSQQGAYYLLQNNVSSTGTCFTVAASNITLDLNGFVVTYATGGGTAYGVSINGDSCGCDSLRVTNGTITQSPNAGSASHGVRIFGNAADFVEVDRLTITVQARDSRNIWSMWASGHNIHDNTLNNNVTVITNRHVFDGTSIYVERAEVGGGEQVTLGPNNVINGGAQAGINCFGNCDVFNNTIRLAATYANAFAVGGLLSGTIHDNIIGSEANPSQGRGIHVDGTNVEVFNNIIFTKEIDQNIEFGGCVLGGAYAIQVENPATNVNVHDNTGVAFADECEASGIRVTSIPPGAGNIIQDNTFEARRVGTTTKTAKAYFSTNTTGGTTVRNNTLIGDSFSIQIDWDGMSNVVFESNTFNQGLNPGAGFAFIDFGNGNTGKPPSTGNIIQDATYGVAVDDSDFTTFGGAIEWGYIVKWTLTLTVRDQNGNPVSGATVTISDATAAQVFTGTTGPSGQIVVPLEEYVRTKNTGKTDKTPHSISISKAGCSPNPDTLSQTMVDAPQAVTRTLSCP